VLYLCGIEIFIYNQNMSIKFKRNIYLDKLSKIIDVDYTSKTPTLSFIYADGVARGWILVAAISTPYVLWLLYKLRKFNWIVCFIVFVLAPFIYSYNVTSINAVLLIRAVATVNWVVFLILLKNSYRNWQEPIFTHSPGSDFRDT